MTKFITFAGQKGGCGKSTLTKLCANYLAYCQKKNVVVLDTDNPQHSLSKLRDIEYGSLPQYIKDRRPESSLYPIIKCSVGDVKGMRNIATILLNDDIRNQLGDFVFVDFQGSMNFKDNNGVAECLKRMDYIFIPFEMEMTSFISQFEATVIYANLKQHNPNLKIVTLFNKYPQSISTKREQSILDEYAGLPVDIRMKSKLPDTVAFKKMDCINTVLPIKHRFLNGYAEEGYRNESKIGDFIDEFYKIVTK